ncbi:DUF3558 domain-containing protein [Tsukamurella paurometabola]|uniref:DUF3558 domain-containing protein n=1 Tax=Tsukamurella paurometabola TaxID=2061 RepID=A0ABS5NJK7_TSUPA|nr:DUF3558 domain-containing protein [Tsukamurella paurometabola]MBS4104496.1 DUF3558 domain-containing protein [Tsukamurella paurometabola]
MLRALEGCGWLRREVSVLLCAIVAGGCAVSVPGEGVPDGNVAARTSVTARPLPFVPQYEGRTNERNDGTTFEPCIAYSDAELRALGADPRSVKDVMISVSPNYRGCRWQSPDSAAYFSQTLGNEVSLEIYKAKQRTRPWQPDRIINGRTVILTTEGDDGCFASFMSENAIVHSAYTVDGWGRKPSPGLVAECNKAIEWATLAISKAP